MSVDLKRADTDDVNALGQACVQRMESLRGYRLSWWSHWALLAEAFFPQKYRWFITQNSYNRGNPLNQFIKDETGLVAARTLGTGLLAGLTSPTKPWFRLGIEGVDDIPEGPVAEWLADVTSRILSVYARSNFYQVLGSTYHQLGVFGSAAVIQYEDVDDVVRFYQPICGEYFFGLDNRLAVDTLYREYVYTISELVKEFGLENLSESSQQMAKQASSLDFEIVIGHAIEPNLPTYQGGEECGYVVPRSFKYRETFWERTGTGAGIVGQAHVLRCAGFREKPFVGLRWDVTSNDAYGRSPGMDALPAVRQLQQETLRKAEAIDKMVRPPLVASVSMKNEPMDILPGGVTFSADPNAGFKPVYQFEPRIQELGADIKDVQARVEEVFFVPLFRMISSEDKVQTATWVDAAREEKLILLGPVIERTENEGLDEFIFRTFSIMSRRGLIPPAPPEVHGAPLRIQYISILAEAQRATSTAAIERVLQVTGGLVAVSPQAMDNINVDAAITYYADLLNVPPEILNSQQAIAAIRAARTQQQQQAEALQTGAAAAQGAQTLSQTDLGGGINALQAMVGREAA